MRATRILTGVAGTALMGVGAFLLSDTGDVTGVLLWLGGAVALHDALIAPLVLLAGLLVRGGWRGPVRGALVVAGGVTAVALPVLLRPGPTANSSVLPLDYPRNWLLVLAAVAVATVLFTAARRLVRGRRRPPSP
ncbi:hypothetical protein ACIHAA_05810 [Streptomyces sp. NPDC052040]|uniref:hypothetical protein n=1 Tax=Streptomyces sp. NPDC052040 TaxID=3365682 RepID=UPI0037D5CDCF